MNMTSLIITSIVSLLSGGGLALLITYRYEKLKAKGLAKQSIEKGDELELNNTEKIINLYKQALSDSQRLWEVERKSLVTEVATLRKQVNSQEGLIKDHKIKIQEQDKLIKRYVNDQAAMKMELKLLKEALNK